VKSGYTLGKLMRELQKKRVISGALRSKTHGAKGGDIGAASLLERRRTGPA
jgi:hypothetical protein